MMRNTMQAKIAVQWINAGGTETKNIKNSLLAKWTALARGWRWDWEVGGMETRFQWRKAHSRTAKCKAFHVAPRLFFMFLFLTPFTIRQQCIIYTPEFFHWTKIAKRLSAAWYSNAHTIWASERVGRGIKFHPKQCYCLNFFNFLTP